MERKLLGKHGAALIIITVMVIAVLTAYKYTRAKNITHCRCHVGRCDCFDAVS